MAPWGPRPYPQPTWPPLNNPDIRTWRFGEYFLLKYYNRKFAVAENTIETSAGWPVPRSKSLRPGNIRTNRSSDWCAIFGNRPSFFARINTLWMVQWLHPSFSGARLISLQYSRVCALCKDLLTFKSN